jgi:DNA-binding IclR family transcriptional regulator
MKNRQSNYFSYEEIKEHTGVALITVKRAIKSLADKKMIERLGRGRNGQYHIGHRLYDWKTWKINEAGRKHGAMAVLQSVKSRFKKIEKVGIQN